MRSRLAVVVSVLFNAMQPNVKAQLPITTAPVISSSATTRPMLLTVMLLPFRSIGDPAKSDWVGGAIDEQLASDLARNSSVRVVRPPTTASSVDGLDAARVAKADRLITGSYQAVDDQVRINGDIVDPLDGKAVGHLKVTGTRRDLFKLEDSLAAELLNALPGVDEPAQSFTVTQIPGETFQQPIIVQNAPTDAGTDSPQNQTYNHSGSGNYGDFAEYGNGYGYGYGYPFYGSPLFVYIGGSRTHDGRRNYGGYGDHSGFRYGQTGGGAVVPTGRVPTIHEPTFPNGVPHNPGPASVTPSRGFSGPGAPNGERGGAGGSGGRR